MTTDRVSASLQLGELKRLSKSMRKLARELRHTDKYEVSSFLPLTDLLIINESIKCIMQNPCLNFPPVFLVLWPRILQNEQYQNKMKQSDERLLALVKAAMDVVVAIGLLQLAPKKVTPRVTGALGFVTSLISCYQVVVGSCLCCVVQVFFGDGSVRR